MSTYGYFKQDAMSDYAIAHHGIKGQKWGIRRFQNEDGSLTEAGKKRYLNKYGILKVSAPPALRDAYNNYQYNVNLKKSKAIPDPPKVTSKQIDDIISKIKINNKSLPKEYHNWFGYSDISDWLSDNVENFDELDWERQTDIEEDLINKIEKKGYNFYD